MISFSYFDDILAFFGEDGMAIYGNVDEFFFHRSGLLVFDGIAVRLEGGFEVEAAVEAAVIGVE